MNNFINVHEHYLSRNPLGPLSGLQKHVLLLPEWPAGTAFHKHGGHCNALVNALPRFDLGNREPGQLTANLDHIDSHASQVGSARVSHLLLESDQTHIFGNFPPVLA